MQLVVVMLLREKNSLFLMASLSKRQQLQQSAPVERVFSQSGLLMRPNRARMSNVLLETLVFLKCNISHL